MSNKDVMVIGGVALLLYLGRKAQKAASAAVQNAEAAQKARIDVLDPQSQVSRKR